jgi:hypothetical protein
VASRPLMLIPEVGGVLSYVWGQRGEKEDRVRPQPGICGDCSAAALCLLARSYAAVGCKTEVVICSLKPGRGLDSRSFHREGVPSRRRAPMVQVECGTALLQ